MDKNSDEFREFLAKLRYFDDRFMQACFKDDANAAKLILRVTAGLDIKEFKSLTFQDRFENLKGHSIIADIHAVANDGKEAIIEIQRGDKGADLRRARYIGSLLDAQLLPASEDYVNIPDNYVIFITEHDVYKNGQGLYKIDSYIDKDGKLEPAGDGRHIIYVNGEYEGDDEVGKLVHDLLCPEPDNMYFEELAKPARYLKKTEEGMSELTGVWEEVYRKGEIKGLKKAAINMLRTDKYSVEDIANITSLPIADIEKIKSEIFSHS